jgi:hypothetical protein
MDGIQHGHLLTLKADALAVVFMCPNGRPQTQFTHIVIIPLDFNRRQTSLCTRFTVSLCLIQKKNTQTERKPNSRTLNKDVTELEIVRKQQKPVFTFVKLHKTNTEVKASCA